MATFLSLSLGPTKTEIETELETETENRNNKMSKVNLEVFNFFFFFFIPLLAPVELARVIYGQLLLLLLRLVQVEDDELGRKSLKGMMKTADQVLKLQVGVERAQLL